MSVDDVNVMWLVLTMLPLLVVSNQYALQVIEIMASC